ncbi:MAG: hypothetical protein A2Y25_10970 [Candidatus Melainabacteria bacterium GWF2_37_15]|nr:MAG: hypothetical protein A2Y25_10970 [Candidatus Melainabacteria bacterium GWF2_37_15]
MGIFAGYVNQNAYQSNFNSFGNYGQNFGQYGQSPYQNSYQNSYFNSIFAMLFMAMLERSPETLQSLFQPQTEPITEPIVTPTIAPQAQSLQSQSLQSFQTSQTWQNFQTLAPITTQIISQSMTSQQSNFTNNTTGSSNAINIWNNYFINTQTPVSEEVAVESSEEPEDVFVISSYANNNEQVNLGKSILDFAGADSGNGEAWNYTRHNSVTANDEALLSLYSKLDQETKDLKFDKGQAYIISKSGEILGVAANYQIDPDSDWDGGSGRNPLNRTGDAVFNKDFNVTSDSLNINTHVENVGISEHEEGVGGKIQLDGTEYNVITTLARKETPLILDLAGNGIDLTSQKDGVNFDLNGDGKIDQTAWTKAESDDAFLVLDKDGNGQIDSGKELFGAQNGAENGFFELAKYDVNKDGKVDINDEVFEKLQTWQDLNHNGQVDDDELKSLLETNIKSVSTSFNQEYDQTGKLKEDQHGNTVGLVGGFERADGSKGTMIDALLQYIG